MSRFNMLAGAALIGGGLAVGQLLAQESGGTGKVTSVSAPFHVLDSKGFPMFQIREEGILQVIEFIGKNSQSIRLTTGPKGASVNLINSASHYVRLEIDETDSHVYVRSGDRAIVLTANPEAQNLTMGDARNSLIDLGMTEGKNAALSVYNSLGEIAAQIGSDYNGGGGSVVVADAKGNVTGYMISENNNEASMGVQIGGIPVAALSTNTGKSGGRIEVLDTSGNPKFVAGLTEENHGGACAETKRGVACLNNAFRMFP